MKLSSIFSQRLMPDKKRVCARGLDEIHPSTDYAFPYLLRELFLCGKRGVLWSSPPAGEGGRGGGPGRPGGRGGAPPTAEVREEEDEEGEGEGLELREGGGGGTSRGIDGR